MKHAMTGAEYVFDPEERLVRVVDREGRTGLFHPDGRWHSGELRFADPQACSWVSGPGLPAFGG
jgi:hypothetical protein